MKDLVLRYQRTRDPVVFGKILKRVDGLVISTINKIKKRENYLEGIELEELYQIGIIGVYDAARTSPKIENPEMFPARIVAYIWSNIRRTFEYRGKPEEATWVLGKDDVICEDDKYVKSLDLFEDIKKMYIEGILSTEDIKLLGSRFFQQQAFRSLGSSRGISHEWARQKLISVIKKMREYFSNS